MMSNASLVGGGPGTAAHVLAVEAGQVGLYYPGILRDVDVVLGGVLGIPNLLALNGVAVMPGWAGNPSAVGGTNLSNYLNGLIGAGVFYLPPNAVNPGALAQAFPSDYMGGATLDRIAARALETYYVGAQMLNWFNGLQPPPAGTGAIKSGVDKGGVSPDDDDPGYNPAYPYDSRWPNYTRTFAGGTKPAPFRSTGAGLTEAPRGALGHWIVVDKAKVANYQIITPTTWNINPKDAGSGLNKTLGLHGPIERCILDTPLVSEAEPLEILRVIHSFDPCCACTVHVMDAKKEKRAKVVVESIA
jgi:Ni,Fe-hydrogenase I large subunit